MRLPSGQDVPLTAALRAALARCVGELAERPLRTIGLAVRDHLPRALATWDGEGATPKSLADPAAFAGVESDLTWVVSAQCAGSA